MRKKPLAREEYQQLVRLLADDSRRKHFCHVKRVRKADLRLAEMLENIPGQFQTSGVLHCVKKHDDYRHLLFLIKISQRLNLEITKQEITIATRDRDRMWHLSKWFVRKIESTPFPPPPWPGNAWIKPVCSRNELKKVRDKFKNCAMSYIGTILLRSRYLYVSARGPAVIEMTRDIVFGWEVGEMEGIRRGKLGLDRRHEIIRAFSGSGFDLCMEKTLRGYCSPWCLIETWDEIVEYEREQHELE